MNDPRTPSERSTPEFLEATASSDSSGDSHRPDSNSNSPEFFGRYRVVSRLGQGGFGIVYRAYDEELDREVAVKVPHRDRLASEEDILAYLDEARVLARLDHPNIVPVYDMGRTEGGCYVVSKLIEGTNSKDRLREGLPSFEESANFVATIAEAVHHAHREGVVHRDIKPANILLDSKGKPYLTDFGLALREEEFGRGKQRAGTPVYMSPEQARGEGHRVDGRSDIFSLGVVFYEFLTGRRPFRAESVSDLLEQIATSEVRPPRQIDDSIPRELERICSKALALRVSDRYTTAIDFAEDLRVWVSTDLDKRGPSIQSASESSTRTDTQESISDTQPIRIVPKGLRSFDSRDSDFFLELLPGPRDRAGLPDSIRFWKNQIEELDPDRTCSVGLIYGPSGCGKSSFLEAGLLPRLAEHVVPVYIEATPEETESRLLRGLHRQLPVLEAQRDLAECLNRVRRGLGLAPGRKVLLVVDQFEQWLHAHGQESGSLLVRALRQCDGGRVQAVVLVRDDFWMATTRFLREMEIRLREGFNSAAVDLFGLRHARSVLVAFGTAFGAIAEMGPTDEQNQFLDEAVRGLEQGGSVIPVRLALFGEMIKGKRWTPETSIEMGGTSGVGVTFLDETFASTNSPPEHRLHQRAARNVLSFLLPELGSDIKGTMRSRAELLQASGYSSRPSEFDDLLRILDSELRLITPTDPEGLNLELPDSDEGSLDPANRYYQLTHDYLVPSLREWLTRKQNETRRGRAQLRLVDRTSLWASKPENRHLPSWWEWLIIRLWTKKRDWTEPQRAMMLEADRYHLFRGGLLLVLLAVLGWGVFEGQGYWTASARVDALITADTLEVPRLVRELDPSRRWADSILEARLPEAKPGSRERLHLALALAPVDPAQVDFLFQQLLSAEPEVVPVLTDALSKYQKEIEPRLWSVCEHHGSSGKMKLRAASALATFSPQDVRWDGVRDAVVEQLARENPLVLGHWSKALRPVRRMLTPSLVSRFEDTPRVRPLISSILGDYAFDRPDVLAHLLLVGDRASYNELLPVFQNHRTQGMRLMRNELLESRETLQSRDARERLARRQARAAVTLLHLGDSEPVWPLLRHSPDPELRSWILAELQPLAVDPVPLVRRLEVEQDTSIRRALIIALGDFGPEQFPSRVRSPVVQKLLDWYRNDPDPGIHGAIDWLLRHSREGPKPRRLDWGQAAALTKIDTELKRRDPDMKRRWYVNGQGQTMALVPGPVEFSMGSPLSDPDRTEDESLHLRKIPRSFAISCKAVTVAQWQEFLNDNPEVKHTFTAKYSPEQKCPIIATTWFEAAQYCNWLSKKEGIPESQWCYPKHSQIRVGMQLPHDFLGRKGYRLPTEAEWEYSCRALTNTSRYFGNTTRVLGRYAWFTENSQSRTWPVGQKRPNALGLFDSHGNVWTWCQDSAVFYPKQKGQDPVVDLGDANKITADVSRVFRGGSFTDDPSSVRSAVRYSLRPTYSYDNVGFRVARTYK